MSLRPLLFSNWWEDLERPHSIFDQNFGVGVNLDDVFNALTPAIEQPRLMILNPRKRHHYNPYERKSGRKSGLSTLHADKDKFLVNLDVQQFSPDEITVKVSGRSVIVEGKHEEKADEHGWVSRQFSRRYLVPEQCEVDALESNLSSDGILSITCPRKKALEDKNERIIPINHTGQPAITDQQAAASSSAVTPTKETPPQKIPVTRSQEKTSKTVKAA